MRTVVLEAHSEKLMQVDHRMENFVFFNVSNESELSFTEVQLTLKLSVERKTILLTNAEVDIYLREANNKQMPRRKELIWMNCLIMNS